MDGGQQETTYVDINSISMSSDPPPKWRVAAELIARMPVGEVISHEWFYFALGYTMREDRLRDPAIELALVTDKTHLRDYLSEHHKLELVSVRGQGYRALHAHEHAIVGPAMRRDTVNKALAYERRMLTNVRTEELSQEQRQQLTNAVSKNSNLAIMLKDKRR
jgi:hypothetical protein